MFSENRVPAITSLVPVSVTAIISFSEGNSVICGNISVTFLVETVDSDDRHDHEISELTFWRLVSDNVLRKEFFRMLFEFMSV